MSARERTREYAMLKTLGFSGQNLISFIAGESIVLSFVGALIGIGLLYMLVQIVSAVVPKQFFPVFYIDTSTYIITSGAALFLGFLASVQPVINTLRTRIVDGLRFIG